MTGAGLSVAADGLGAGDPDVGAVAALRTTTRRNPVGFAQSSPD
jgi:hypothetical protein